MSRKRENIQFEPAAVEIVRLINDTKANVFCTGRAGTGKSTLVRHIMDNCRKSMLVCAPTGIAAMNAFVKLFKEMHRLKILCSAIDIGDPFSVFTGIVTVKH